MPPTENLTCEGCAKQITDKKGIRCCDSKCGKVYHLPCVNLKNPNSDTIKAWLCPVCSCSMKKGGDNSSTPARAAQNVTVRKPKAASPEPEPLSKNTSPLDNLAEQIKLLRKEIKTMKLDFSAAISAVSRCETRINELSTTMTSYDVRLKLAEESILQVAELKKLNDGLQNQIVSQAQELSALKSRMQSMESAIPNAPDPEIKSDYESLQEQLNFQAQARLRNDIEISGVTESPAENPLHLFLTLAVLAGRKVSESDIDYVTRAGPKRDNPNDSPRPLVVRFCRRGTRDSFYNSAKPRRLTTKDLKLEGPVLKIYFNDRLTRENRQLFRVCRAEFKEAGYKFCWTKWGQIFVKKREGRGEGAEAIIIKSHRDIANILKDKPAPIPDNISLSDEE